MKSTNAPTCGCLDRALPDAAVEPMPVNLEQTRQLIAERLRTVDAMRLVVFGRAR